ncbi:AAA ATPase-like protein [Aminivibrio pyruvatiphilus]|uniref:AAA ATPase-like protein n=1 Tax=Aminivibrio pyruvatiphilus TaxID=1005740 RepID=A0A4R8M774_9BACT|nr:AAA family ATPase [Aminivibrio pyruvatiphilus]TDY61260.1 AAA ATPase-like protein [Aminivibrio pyruvatiphilus]
MNSVYLNNFRGFNKTLIPILPVNFLVGENSTGKSSLLALVELLSTQDFWFSMDFNVGNYEFGGYKDIVSVLAKDQKEFQIGVCKEASKDRTSHYYLMHYREAKNGLPEMSCFSQMSNKYVATMRLSKKQIYVYFSTEIPECVKAKKKDECFAFLHDAGTGLTPGYKVLSGNEAQFLRRSPIVSFPFILRDFFDRKEELGMLRMLPPPKLGEAFGSMAPIRTTPKRTYDGYTQRFSPEGEHTPYVIRKELPKGSKKSNPFKNALEDFGENSGLFKSVGVTQFGKDSSSPFELTVKLGTKDLRVNSVGYGVSQVLPVVVELLVHGKNSCLAIQQPEVHLHPRAQAALGDVLFHAAVEESQTLLVETHSDYLIDRFRLNMRDRENLKDFTQVLFFERNQNGNCVIPMVIEPNGEYPEEQPLGFRNFFLAEQKRILGV